MCCSPNSHQQVRPRPNPSSQLSAVNSFKINSITNTSSITLLNLKRKLKVIGLLIKRKGLQSPKWT